MIGDDNYKNNFEEDDEDFLENDGGKVILSLMGGDSEDKPFGFYWEDEEMKSFLESRGYRIATFPPSSDDEEEIYVAYKKGDKLAPEPDPFSLRDTFNKEVKNILLKWLLKIGK